MFVTGFLIDSGVVWLSKRNRGIYEPEFRLWFMLAMLFGVFGYVGWAGRKGFGSWIILTHSPSSSRQRPQDALDWSSCLYYVGILHRV